MRKTNRDTHGGTKKPSLSIGDRGCSSFPKRPMCSGHGILIPEADAGRWALELTAQRCVLSEKPFTVACLCRVSHMLQSAVVFSISLGHPASWLVAVQATAIPEDLRSHGQLGAELAANILCWLSSR